MYKVIFSIAVCLFFTAAKAQDVKTAKDFLTKSQFEKAAAAIDKAVAGTDANNPMAWVVKHTIYQALANSSEYKGSTADANLQGFNALVKASKLPKGDEAMIREIGINYINTFNNYYTSFITDGSTKMNANDNKEAFKNFKNGLTVSTFFYNEKMTTTALDTMLTFYAGYTAMKNNDFANAEYYFKKLSDANASGTDLQIAYGWLSNYYIADKKDATNAKIVCDKGLAHYPKDEYLLSVKKQIAGASGNLENVFAIYEETISKGNASFSDYLGYGAELYDYLYVNENKNAITNADTKEKKLEEVLLKAISLKNTSAEANYILGMSYTSKALQKDADKKKMAGVLTPEATITKKELEKAITNLTDNSIKYLEAAATLYEAISNRKPSQTEHYKTALQQLANLYKYRSMAEKKAAVEKKLQGL
jgi:hypothetical protein